jgi:hypothetical protein
MGKVKVWAEESLEASVTGLGSVEYRGDPAELVTHNTCGITRM